MVESTRGRSSNTHGESDFADRDVLPGDANSILLELPIRQKIDILPGDTITARPTLEPCSVESIFLHRHVRPKISGAIIVLP